MDNDVEGRGRLKVRPFTEGSDIITDLNAPLLNFFLLIAHDTVVGSQYHARTFTFFSSSLR
jgi:hypothetical protein